MQRVQLNDLTVTATYMTTGPGFQGELNEITMASYMTMVGHSRAIMNFDLCCYWGVGTSTSFDCIALEQLEQTGG